MSKHKWAMVSLSAVAAATAALAGCSGNSGGGGSSGSGAPEAPAAPVKIEFMLGTSSPLPKNDYLKQAFDKKFNTDITLNVPTTEFDSALNVRMASGDYPDMIMMNLFTAREYAAQGMLLDLTPHKDKLAQVWEFVGENNQKAGIMEGKLQAIGKRGGKSEIPQDNYWIRKDWLDRLQLKPPTTVEELLAVAKAFTERDPDGNGKNDTFGMTGVNLSAFVPVFGAYGVGVPHVPSGDVQKGAFYLKDDKLVNTFHDPGMKDALTAIKSFMDAGVVDPDLFANTNSTDDEKAFKGQVGIIYNGFAPFTRASSVEIWKNINPNAEWMQLAPPKGPGGQFAGSQDIGQPDGMLVFPKTLEKDQAKLNTIFEMVNYASTEEGNNLVSFGEEGRHYTIKDGKYEVNAELRAQELFWPYQLTGRSEMSYLINSGFPEEAIQQTARTPRIKAYTSYVIMPKDYVASDAERYIQEEFAKFIYGKRPIAEYDAFLDTLNTTFKYKLYTDAAEQQLKALGIVK